MAPKRKWPLEYTHHVIGRQERTSYVYVRRPGHPADGVRLRGHVVWTEGKVPRPDAAMLIHYEALMTESLPVKPVTGTFAALVADYQASPEFTKLRERTQKDYIYQLGRLVQKFGTLPVAGIDREIIYRLRDTYADKPRTATYVVQVLRLLFSWAVERGRMKKNPAKGVKGLRMTPRQEVWSPEAEAAFLAAADGSMTLAYMLAIYTAQRQGDILCMTWSQYDGARLRIRQSKTGTLIVIPVHPDLKRVLDGLERRSVMILTTEAGQPFKADHFRHRWRTVTLAAGLNELQFRDLRRTAAVRLSEAGATPQEVAAITGHTIDQTTKILETYIPRTQAMADAAIAKLAKRGTRPDA